MILHNILAMTHRSYCVTYHEEGNQNTARAVEQNTENSAKKDHLSYFWELFNSMDAQMVMVCSLYDLFACVYTRGSSVPSEGLL